MKTKYVVLYGGLGNQLFQIGRAISQNNFEKIEVLLDYGNYRMNSDGLPEIASFAWPTNLRFCKHRKRNIFAQKLLNYAIRLSTSEHRKFMKGNVQFWLNVFLTLNLKRVVRVKIANGIGFCDLDGERYSLHIGYFQSYKFIKNMEIIRDVKLKNYSQNLLSNINLLRAQDPIILHIRLGDYKNNPQFGVLGEEYYLQSINILMDVAYYRKIWVFSDDIHMTKKYFKNLANDFQLRFISTEELNTSETFELMRHGSRYVIANSTFSWWAAFLTVNENAKVIAPVPWFSMMKDPVDILPLTWKKLDRM